MKLNTKGRYAVMALADIAKFDNSAPVSLRDISLRQGISLLYLEQIFSKLKKNKIVQSIRGTQGGYILSKKSKEIPCLNDISLKDTGLTLLNLARSAKAITAYLPFDVNFILPLFKKTFYTNLTKLVKYTISKKDNILSLSYDKCIFF